jgi:hypothetical protein
LRYRRDSESWHLALTALNRVITWGESGRTSTLKWDVQIESNELLFVFRTQLRDLSLATNYLKISTDSDCTRAVA